MPQLGQEPGPLSRTSGCIGQVCSPAAAGAGPAAFPSSSGAARKRSGSASNFCRQPSQQKRTVRPPCSARCGESAATVMPQTGSTSATGSVVCFGSASPAWCASSFIERSFQSISPFTYRFRRISLTLQDAATAGPLHLFRPVVPIGSRATGAVQTGVLRTDAAGSDQSPAQVPPGPVEANPGVVGTDTQLPGQIGN